MSIPDHKLVIYEIRYTIPTFVGSYKGGQDVFYSRCYFRHLAHNKCRTLSKTKLWRNARVQINIGFSRVRLHNC